MSNACATRAPRGDDRMVDVTHDADILAGHLEDAAHYPGGHAAGVAFPRSEADVARLVRSHPRILPVGAQSSLTGGATPFGEVLLDMRHFDTISPADDDSSAAVGAGTTLDRLLAVLHDHGATFPPVPTFTGATVGGSVANCAAGAATFKYGSIRKWVEGLTIVLANGDVLDITRGECIAADDEFIIETSTGRIRLPVPTYRMPDTPKCSAGYFSQPAIDLVDLFVGSEGTLGIITEATLRTLHPAPGVGLALVFCPSERCGIELTEVLRKASLETRRLGDADGLDVCAIEYLDDRSLALLRTYPDHGSTLTIPPAAAVALLIQIELPREMTAADAWHQIESALWHDQRTGLRELCRWLDRFDLLDSTTLATPGEVDWQQQLTRLREAVPARVNQLVGAAKRDVDSRIEKTAADMIVPFERFGEMMEIYRRGFASRDLDFAIWGHISDGNVHPNVIPRRYEDVQRGKEAVLEFGRAVANLGGCPLAEHGVGRNPIKQTLLHQMYGDAGINEMRAVKRALDPEWKLAPGVIFPL